MSKRIKGNGATVEFNDLVTGEPRKVDVKDFTVGWAPGFDRRDYFLPLIEMRECGYCQKWTREGWLCDCRHIPDIVLEE